MGLDIYTAKGPREGISPKWENIQGNRFWLHVKNSFYNSQSYWVVMVGSEFLVTEGVQAQATRLLSENVEDGLSGITSESGLK